MTSIIRVLFWFASAYAVAHDKADCRATELKTRDCHLTLADFQLDLLDKTVAWSDGTWHSVDPMPLSGEGIEWEKIRFARLQNRPILQMWIWDKGVGETSVQSEHWFVAALINRKLRVLAEGVVAKRRLKSSPAIDGSAETPTSANSGATAFKASGTFNKTKYLYDAAEPHGLKPLREGEFEWTLGTQTKKITVGP